MHKQLVGIRGATGILVDVEHDAGRDGDAAEVRGRPVGAGCPDQHGAAGRPLKVAGFEGTAGDGDIVDRLVEFRPLSRFAVQTGIRVSKAAEAERQSHQQSEAEHAADDCGEFLFHVHRKTSLVKF